MRHLVASAVAILLTSCSYAPFYTGDGKLTDNGIWAYSRRFVIDLGAIDLDKLGTRTYTLSGMPRARMVVSFQITEEIQNTWEGKPNYPATVKVHLTNENQQTVILEEAPLNSWVRSFGVLNNISELYRSGKSRDIPLPGGGTRGEFLEVKPSGGWGTYFDAEPGQTYRLNVEVLASSMSRPTRMLVVGWSR